MSVFSGVLTKSSAVKITPSSGSPFSGVLGTTPTTKTPFTVAHEQIHQIPSDIGGGAYMLGVTPDTLTTTPRGYAGLPQLSGQERDHITPISLGGASVKENLQYQQGNPNETGTATGEKDKLEQQLAKELKAGKISLSDARLKMLKYNFDQTQQKKSAPLPQNPFNPNQQILSPKDLTVSNFFSGLKDISDFETKIIKKGSDVSNKFLGVLSNVVSAPFKAVEVGQKAVGAVPDYILNKTIGDKNKTFSQSYKEAKTIGENVATTAESVIKPETTAGFFLPEFFGQLLDTGVATGILGAAGSKLATKSIVFEITPENLSGETVYNGKPIPKPLVDALHQAFKEAPTEVIDQVKAKGLKIKINTPAGGARQLIGEQIGGSAPGNNLHVEIPGFEKSTAKGQPSSPFQLLHNQENVPHTEVSSAAENNPIKSTVPPSTPFGLAHQNFQETKVPEVKSEGATTIYHGTKAPINSLNEADVLQYGARNALYGPGLYVTDNPKVAEGYALTKGKGEPGKVLSGTIKPDVKLLDLDKNLSPGILQIMEKVANQGTEGEHISFSNSNGQIAMREFMKSLDGLPHQEASDIIDSLHYNLEQLGYDGFSHTGGQITKGVPSNVSILWDGGKRSAVDKIIASPQVKIEKSTPSKVAQSIETKAVEQGLTNGFSEVAGYDPITIKDQAEKAAHLMNTDIQKATQMVKGEIPMESGLRGEMLIKAMEDYAQSKNDVRLLMDISNSPLVSETSAHAQAMRLLAERNPDSAVAKMREIKQEREKALERKTGKKVSQAQKETTEEIKQAVKKSAPTKEDWNSFVDSIICT